MPWYIPAILVPAFILSAYYALKALNEVEKRSDTWNVMVLGLWARDEHFTPAGRRYRMWSLSFLGGGVLLVVLIYLFASIK